MASIFLYNLTCLFTSYAFVGFMRNIMKVNLLKKKSKNKSMPLQMKLFSFCGSVKASWKISNAQPSLLMQTINRNYAN